MSQALGPISRSFYHAWVPRSNDTHDQFIKDTLKVVLGIPPAAYEPSVTKFAETLRAKGQDKLFEQAILQVQNYYAKWGDPSLFVTSFDNFLALLNHIIRSAPRLYKANINGVTIGEPVGVPLYLILDLISNTSAAYTLLTENSFNRALELVLNDWRDWLEKPESSYTLANEWFSKEGLAILQSPLGGKTFDETFAVEIPRTEKDGQRYFSWDSFFVRQFLNIDELRPIVYSQAADVSFLYNPCESTAFRTIANVQCHDTFWLKTQNYSLYDVLGGDLPGSFAKEWAPKLKGASAFQAFLSPADYHCWHNPIAGNVIAKVFPGTYFAVLPDEGAPAYDPDLEPGDPHGAIIRSQPWLSVAATRAVFIIEPRDSDNSPVEVAALIEIGMVEVSSCIVTYPGHEKPEPAFVDVGKEIGAFHFGGSSFLLIVKPKKEYRLVYQDIYNSPIRPGQHRWVRSVIGQFWKNVPGVTPDPDVCWVTDPNEA